MNIVLVPKEIRDMDTVLGFIMLLGVVVAACVVVYLLGRHHHHERKARKAHRDARDRKNNHKHGHTHDKGKRDGGFTPNE